MLQNFLYHFSSRVAFIFALHVVLLALSTSFFLPRGEADVKCKFYVYEWNVCCFHGRANAIDFFFQCNLYDTKAPVGFLKGLW